MKRLVLLLFAMLSTISIFGQNFTIDKTGGVIWQMEYKTDMTSNELYKSLHISPYLHSIEKIDSSFFIAIMKQSKVEYEHLGYKRMHLPLYLVNNDVGNANVIIQYKEGKYRITLNNIDLISFSNLEYGTLNDMAIAEDGSFTDTFTSSASPIYHSNFAEWFEFEKVSDNW